MKKIFVKAGFLVVIFSQLAFFNFGTTQTPELNLNNVKRISRACYLIQHEYYDESRVKPREMLEEGFYELAKEVPEILPKFDGNKLTFKLAAKQQDIDISGVKQFYDVLLPVSQAFDFIHANYKGEIKFEDMEYAFISGMLAKLDPHSAMLPPKAYEEFKTQTSGQYGGLGIVIGEKESELTVIAPIEDTPAFRAGILADDKILQIGDQASANMTLSEAVDLMRGPAGTKVTLKIKSKTLEPRDVVLTREIIEIVSVQSKLLDQNGKKVGVLRVKGFQEDTYSDMIKNLEKLKTESGGKLHALILDMRNNPGGLLDQAILIADRFLASGDIVYTETAGELEEEVEVAKNQAEDVLLPMIVLINEGSASASEIVAGALKNNDRAIVLGKKSFGKGSVQSLFSLRDGSSLKLTVAQYLTPGRVSIQAEGISPDIHLYPSVVSEELLDLREDADFSEKKLDAHLENVKRLKSSEAFYNMTFLKKEVNLTESQYTTKIREADDYLLTLSAKLLAAVETADKKMMLKQFQPILEKATDEQDDLISAALKGEGVDWTAGRSNIEPKLDFRYQFLDEEGSVVQAMSASSTVKLKVFVRNRGESPVHRVIGEIEAFNPLVNAKELVFGKIDSGQEVSSEFQIKVPAEIINFKEEVVLNVYTAEAGEAPVKTMIATQFLEKISPNLAYSYRLIDGGGSGTVGNSNGVPERGEKVSLEVTVKNLGPGISEKTIVNLQNTQGDHVFLTKGRATLGELKTNQEAKAELRFDVRESFDKEDFSIKLFALDDQTKTNISDTLKFSAKKTPVIDPVFGQLQVTPRIEISAATTQIKDKYKVVATIIDDAKLKDIAVFVKGKKLYYDNLLDQSVKNKVIDVDVPLVDGLNSIVIQARGGRDLINQKSLSIVYHDLNKVVAKTN